MAFPKNPKSLRIGVMMENVQLADIMGIDLLGSLGHPPQELLDADPRFLKFKDHFVEIEWFYIASTLEPSLSTCNFKWLPNVTYDNCPRDLDIVLTGGPLLSHRPAAADKFMKEAFAKTKVWMTTCTGALWLASSGVLDGKRATANRMLLPMTSTLSPGVTWVDQKWVVEEKEYEGEGQGELWTSGGALGAGKPRLSCLPLIQEVASCRERN